MAKRTTDNRVKEHTVKTETAPGKFAHTTVRGTDADLKDFLASGDNGVGVRSVDSKVAKD